MQNTNKKEQVVINLDGIKEAGALFKAVSHPLRLQMMDLMSQHDEVNVNVIYHTLGIEQSITSQHLQKLRQADAVKTRRDGKKIFYSINIEKFKKIDAAIKLLV